MDYTNKSVVHELRVWLLQIPFGDTSWPLHRPAATTTYMRMVAHLGSTDFDTYDAVVNGNFLGYFGQ